MNSNGQESELNLFFIPDLNFTINLIFFHMVYLIL